jgi:uncharacterized membrane protein YheB (UPF0754 family)
MKVNIQFMRKKYEMNPRKIKELITLEDRMSAGKINKELVEQIGKLYKQFMEYCEYLREPLKLYFQEKLEYLYLNEKIAKMLIKQDNRKRKEDIKVLSESFLNFSEIQETPEIGLEEYFSANNYSSEQKERQKEMNLKGKPDKTTKKRREIRWS